MRQTSPMDLGNKCKVPLAPCPWCRKVGNLPQKVMSCEMGTLQVCKDAGVSYSAVLEERDSQ